MEFSIQPHLENEIVRLIPMKEIDFERIYAVSSDPAVWANHPNKNRCEREVFKNFFRGAMESGGAFLVQDKKTEKIIGSTRFYDYDEKNKSIFIGYTFYAVEFWGKGYNYSAKKLMLDFIFEKVEKVIFHVGAENFRSQAAMKKLGAKKVGEIEIAYYGEPLRRNVEYEIKKSDWLSDSDEN
ncbi:MAG: GNAT family N-acetyltransferase [Weeksellaceae bacterium]|nr:GNAT family N-acetyltransferase [Weeksellaceae bacterium]MDX9704983.1 GNAT family N-acetyltransferase [Weeksellaceae bacterium]